MATHRSMHGVDQDLLVDPRFITTGVPDLYSSTEMLLIVAFMVIKRCYQVRCYSTIFNYNFQTVLNAILYHKSRYFHRNHRYILRGMNVSSKAWLNAFYMIIFTLNRLSTALMWQSLYAIVYSTKIMSLICFIWYSNISLGLLWSVWEIYPFLSGKLHWYCANHMITDASPVWIIWVK